MDKKMLVDSHAHTCDEKFDADRNAVLNRAFTSGVKYIIEVGCEPETWDNVFELSQKENIFSMFGIHPQDSSKFSDDNFNKLKTLLSDKKCVAVGEIGLDYHYDLSPRNVQKEVFIKQMNLAVEIEKPVCIHCRSAYDDMLKILKDFKKLPKGVIHCFSGNLEEANAVLDMGFLIGIDGPCTYPKSDKLREIIASVDIAKLLIETDCPYLSPQLYRGQRNEPSYVVEIAKKIAEIKNIPLNDVCNMTSANTIKLFNLWE
ncbi:MAG: TatD family hydrolase [Endomicrobiia bacterium]